MGPIALFDKSFLHALSLDESVWFDHFFSANVCPVFYIETLADIAKTFRGNKSAVVEVQKIAQRFPECGSYPCISHMELCTAELLGYKVPMNGQIPMAHGRPVEAQGQTGVVFDDSPEAEAFARWCNGEFDELEKRIASAWRIALSSLDLQAMGEHFRKAGISGKTCKSLEEAATLAHLFATGTAHKFERMSLVLLFFNVPKEAHPRIFDRWARLNYPTLSQFSPYVSYALSVEIFFQLSIAAHLISADRPSNRTDIAYLFYLPFCHVFISFDRLHRNTSKPFLRKDQQFLWGADLKADLKRINEHFSAYPDSEKQRGIVAFAKSPPNLTASPVAELWNTYCPGWMNRDDNAESRTSEDTEEILTRLKAMKSAPAVPVSQAPLPGHEDYVALERHIHKKRGSWWQLPANLEVDDDKEES